MYAESVKDDVSSVGSRDEQSEAAIEEEERSYRLPPLPPVSAPALINGIPLADVYRYITELRKRVDVPSERQKAAKLLQDDPNVLLAVAMVLQESQALYRSTGHDAGSPLDLVQIPPSALPRPTLPTGYTSWIGEEIV